MHPGWNTHVVKQISKSTICHLRRFRYFCPLGGEESHYLIICRYAGEEAKNSLHSRGCSR